MRKDSDEFDYNHMPWQVNALVFIVSAVFAIVLVMGVATMVIGAIQIAQ